MLANLRSTLAHRFTRLGQCVATDPGWGAIRAGRGAPGMLSGLMHLRDRGFSPAVVVDLRRLRRRLDAAAAARLSAGQGAH